MALGSSRAMSRAESADGAAVLVGAEVPRPGLGFRRDIQGLRALAVLMVIAFHAGLPVPGGFVGVDVFFVISGFVITSVLSREWQATGRIDLRRFYVRRFKRLTPALALMVAATVVASAFVLSPFGPQQRTAQTALGALLLSANIVITSTTGGYFDGPATTNPLLHTWSLSVEEQFYLLFPLILVTAWAIQRRWRRSALTPALVVATIAAVSLALALWALHHPAAPHTDWLLGFYGPLHRAWEFAVGALLSLLVPALAKTSRPISLILTLAGALMLTAAIFLMSEATPVPGPWTLLPVVGTLCMIAGGLGEPNLATRALASKPMVQVGDWSYSLYLWHWPFIVFASVCWPDRKWTCLLAALVSAAPALASHAWLEMPLRMSAATGVRLAAIAALILVPSAALALGLAYAADSIWAPRLTAADTNLAFHGEVAWKDHDYRFGGFEPCASKPLRTLFENGANYEPRCQQSKPGPDVHLALLGDSHAEHLFIGLVEALPTTNIMYFMVNAYPSKADPNFAAALTYVLQTRSIDTVILTAAWSLRGVDQRLLSDVVSSLGNAGKRVLLTDDVPNFDFDPFGCKVRRTRCSQDAEDFNRRSASNRAKLLTVTKAAPNVRLLETAHYLCDAQLCSMTLGDDILYADPNHLNVLGSRYVGRRMVADYGGWLK